MESSFSRKVIIAICLLQSFCCYAGVNIACDLPNQIKTGDLVFRYQDSLVSKLVLSFQGDLGYSHVGVAIRHNQELLVVHAEYDPSRDMDGVVWEDYCSYAQSAKKILVTRQSFYPEKNSGQIMATIKRFGVKKFNLNLSNDDRNNVYCSQFVWLIFLELYGKDVFELKNYPRRVITVKDLYLARKFRTVYAYQ